jgi:flavin-dependent dehydrogenase
MNDVKYPGGMMPDYDVIIAGGRPAGSTLAARLGQAGLRVLLLERAQFPCPPAASSPIIYASTMNLLDEIGADETAYAHNTPKIYRMVSGEIDSPFGFTLRIPDCDGRDYAYAIDRARFDAALWQTAVNSPNVTGKQGFSVTDVLWEGDRVTGVTGQNAAGEKEAFTADVVVGADGRYSLIARKVKAESLDEEPDYPTTLYYAYWKNVAPYDDQGAVASAYGDGSGVGYLVMDSADDTTVVCIEGQSALVDPAPGQLESFYLDILRQRPALWSRLQNAQRVTDIRGMKRIGNLYRAPGGSGWALVGDAYHQKDPIDGQGIYDAVFTAKALAKALIDWKKGKRTWKNALAYYDKSARAETYGMYRSTLDRVKGNLYGEMIMPDWDMLKLPGMDLFIQATMPIWVRWMLEDRVCQEKLGLMLTRQTSPEALLDPNLFFGALMRGPLRDLSKRLDEEIQRGNK